MVLSTSLQPILAIIVYLNIVDIILHRGPEDIIQESQKMDFNYTDKLPALNSSSITMLQNILYENNVTMTNASLRLNKLSIKDIVEKLIDMAIDEIAWSMKINNLGKIKIPNLNTPFSTNILGFKINGALDANNGSFGDLTTLKRSKDTGFRHQGTKFTATCGLGLSKAFIDFQEYQLRYGFLRMKGLLSVILQDASISITLGLDYGKLPCTTLLDSFQLKKDGKFKIKLTGVGPLNPILSKFVTDFVNISTTQMLEFIEKKLHQEVLSYLRKFNCVSIWPW